MGVAACQESAAVGKGVSGGLPTRRYAQADLSRRLAAPKQSDGGSQMKAEGAGKTGKLRDLRLGVKICRGRRDSLSRHSASQRIFYKQELNERIRSELHYVPLQPL